MLDLHTLADLGRASVDVLWLPIAAWTAVALVLEGALRLTRPAAALSLPVRGTLLASLPLAVAVPVLLRAFAPATVQAVAAAVPSVVWLPEIATGGPAPIVEDSGPPALEVALGIGVAIVALASVVALIRLLFGVLDARRVRFALEAGSDADQRAVDGARRRLEVAQRIVAVRAPDGAAPFTVGWRRPVVALPTALDAGALEVAALHEVAHIRRSDYAWHAAQRAVSAVFAAHPLVWALGRGLDLDRERAADAAVLEAGADRRTYADLLFSFATLPAPSLALGAARGSSSLKSRIDAMKRPLSLAHSRRLGFIGRLAGLAALALTVAGATVYATPSEAPSAPVVRTVEGLVVDADTRLPIVGANVLITGATLGASMGAATGPDGRYTVLNVPDGDLVVQVTAPGFEWRAVNLADGQTELNVALTVGNVPPPPPAPPSAGQSAPAPDIFQVAEVQPQLVGGLAALQARVVYPQEARDAGIEGQVVVQFVVNEQGRVQDAVVLRSPDEMLSRAALEAVNGSEFVPGRQRGEPVKVRFAVPVTFRLPGGDGVD